MRGFTIPLFFVWLAFLMPVQLRAQEAEGSELDAVKKELAELREEVNELREERDLDTYRNERKIDSFLSRIRIYGDVGLRLHHVWSDGSRVLPNGGKDLVFRPEYRVRLGATGYVREDADRKHRIKYNIRISTKGLSEFDAPLGTPTEAWAP